MPAAMPPVRIIDHICSLASASRAASMSAAAASAAVVSNGRAATVMSSPRASSRPTAVIIRSRICCWLRLPATASSMTTETVSRLMSPGAPSLDRRWSCRRRCSRSSTPCRTWSRRRRRWPPASGMFSGPRTPPTGAPAAGVVLGGRALRERRGARRRRCRSPRSSRAGRGRRRRARRRPRGRGRRPGRASSAALAASRASYSCSTWERASPAAAVTPVPAAESTWPVESATVTWSGSMSWTLEETRLVTAWICSPDERRAGREVEQHRGGRLGLLGHEDLVLGQGDVHDGRVDAVERLEGLGQLALQGPLVGRPAAGTRWW